MYDGSLSVPALEELYLEHSAVSLSARFSSSISRRTPEATIGSDFHNAGASCALNSKPIRPTGLVS